MASVCFYFQVHQPYRTKKYRVFDIGHDHHYFNDKSDQDINNEKILHKVATKCYRRTNRVLLELLERYPQFKCTFSLSGTVIEQMEEFSPETLETFRALVKTGRVEILDETYHHSLSFLYSKPEFEDQVALHRAKVQQVFGVTPTSFRNTELIYSNELASYIEKMGYKAVLAEGADHILGWRSPNFLYSPPGGSNIRLLLKNYRLSDDIAFRFSSRDWVDWPLTSEKFAQWVNAVNGNGNLVNLFMDYETFGEHQWEDTGIFDFLLALPGEILKHPDNDFVTVTEAAERYQPVGEVDVPYFISWADIERDLSAWLGNSIQHEAIQKLYSLEARVKDAHDPKLLDDWRKLTTSDHFYYMCTKWFADGDVHKYFNPYNTPYEAFIAYNNILHDLEYRLDHHRAVGTHHAPKHLSVTPKPKREKTKEDVTQARRTVRRTSAKTKEQRAGH